MIDRRTLLTAMAAAPFAARAAMAQAPSGAALHTARIPGADVAVPVIGIGAVRRLCRLGSCAVRGGFSYGSIPGRFCRGAGVWLRHRAALCQSAG